MSKETACFSASKAHCQNLVINEFKSLLLYISFTKNMNFNVLNYSRSKLRNLNVFECKIIRQLTGPFISKHDLFTNVQYHKVVYHQNFEIQRAELYYCAVSNKQWSKIRNVSLIECQILRQLTGHLIRKHIFFKVDAFFEYWTALL